MGVGFVVKPVIRLFVSLEARPNIRDAAQRFGLTELFDDCVRLLAAWRKHHMKIVRSYVVKPNVDRAQKSHALEGSCSSVSPCKHAACKASSTR